MEKKLSPMVKTLARVVTPEEIGCVSGAGGGTVVKVGKAASETQENTYNKQDEYIGVDTVSN